MMYSKFLEFSALEAEAAYRQASGELYSLADRLRLAGQDEAADSASEQAEVLLRKASLLRDAQKAYLKAGSNLAQSQAILHPLQKVDLERRAWKAFENALEACRRAGIVIPEDDAVPA